MTKFYSLISFHIPGERDSFYQQRQLQDGVLSIGWGFENPGNFQTEDELFHMIWNGYDTLPETEHNARNGAKSLQLFMNVQIGDIIFVRGDARIIDVVRVSGTAEYNPDLNHHDWYFTYIPFEQLRPGEQIYFPLNEMKTAIRQEFIFNRGRYRAFKEVNSDSGITLLSNIISRI